MKRILWLSLAAIAAVAIILVAGQDRAAKPVSNSQASASNQPVVVSAPGRVEPISEEVDVGSFVGGRLESVRVEEGDVVKKGHVIAVIANGDYRARVAVADAQVKRAEAALRRAVNGSRDQERGEALAQVREAEAVLDNALAEMERGRTLARTGDISRSDFDRTERELAVASERVAIARERAALVEAGPREEDRAQARADLALARARLAEAQALMDKTIIRAPLSGTVLRRYMRTGETITDGTDSPIVTLGDRSILRVRAEVDETDVARVRVGQKAYVRADAYGDRKFSGRVVRLGPLVGKKKVTTERPSERIDTKVRDAIIELDPGQDLPTGLRVDAFIG